MVNDQITTTQSDMILKKCKEESIGNPKSKKLRKLHDSVRKLVKDPEIRKEGEKKGRLASESNLSDDDNSTPKTSRTSSPLK